MEMQEMNQNKKVAARIKEYEPRKGQVCRRYTYMGKRFDIDVGWYKVDRVVGEELAKLQHPDTGSEIFDVVEIEEAEKLDELAPMAGQALPASRAPDVRGREFARAREIAEARNHSDEGTDDDLEAILKPRRKRDEDEDFDAEFDPEKDEPEEPASSKAVEAKKKASRRRSQTK